MFSVVAAGYNTAALYDGGASSVSVGSLGSFGTGTATHRKENSRTLRATKICIIPKTHS